MDSGNFFLPASTSRPLLVRASIHDRHHVGIRFLDMSSRKREQLEVLIEEIEDLKSAWNRE